MNTRKLIVGKNSTVVTQLQLDEYKDYTIVSHKDLRKLDFRIYDKIFVFSWTSNVQKMLSLMESLPIKKVVFVSSVAVGSSVKRRQWSNYVNSKISIENHVLEHGGTVIRLGHVVEDVTVLRSDVLLYTTHETIISFMSSNIYRNIINLYEVNLHFRRSKYAKWTQLISNFLPNYLWIQIFLYSFARFFMRSNDRNYTADVNDLFLRDLQIGVGAVGSMRMRGQTNYCFKRGSNYWINDNADGIRTNEGKFGLGSLWHGVSYRHVSFEWYKRCVPVFLVRPSIRAIVLKFIPTSSIFEFDVETLDYCAPVISVCGSSRLVKEFEFRPNKVFLCNGALGTVQVLINSAKSNDESCLMSEHQVANVGTISRKEAERLGFVKSFLFLNFYNYSKVQSNTEFMALVEARPVAPSSDINLFNQRVIKIFQALLKDLNYKRINLAFYNKFGFCFAVDKYDLYFQYLLKNQVIVTKKGPKLLEPQNHDKELAALLKHISSGSILHNKIQKVYGQHLHVNTDEILIQHRTAIKKRMLVISSLPVIPSCRPPLHTTMDLIRKHADEI